MDYLMYVIALNEAMRMDMGQNRGVALRKPLGSGGLSVVSRARTVVLTGLVLGALLLGGAAVLAEDVTCDGGPCAGTAQDDTIVGSAKKDAIRGRGGNDLVIADPFVRDASPKADDTIRGGRGKDSLAGNASVIQIALGADADVILGGRGNDEISVLDEDSQDRVDCGPGEKDTVFFDKGDTVENCEVKNPPDVDSGLRELLRTV